MDINSNSTLYQYARYMQRSTVKKNEGKIFINLIKGASKADKKYAAFVA